MAQELQDPNLPPHAIVEERKDGSALRNDGVELAAANTNPWYVLATVFGEQPEGAKWLDYDRELAAKNRRAWNGWFCGDLGEKTRQARAESTGLDATELAPLTDAERQEIIARFRDRIGSETGIPTRTENMDFSKTNFSKTCVFEKFVFEKSTDFVFATFGGDANFGSATFGGYAYFVSATFGGYAYFVFATFGGYAYFVFATFGGDANFGSATFKSTTRFDDARFLTAVPEFHATDLYDDTTFTLPENYRDNWPPIKGSVTLEGETKPRKVMSAAEQKRAYNRLRLFMNRSLQVESEQFFHRMEMRCKAVTDSRHYRPLYWLFEVLSDYGNSVGRPLLGLFVLWLIGVPARLEWTAGNIWADAGTTLPAMGWSFANLFPFFGFRRLYFDVETLTAGQAFIGGLQTVFGFVLLFLLGLGLRNRFRLR